MDINDITPEENAGLQIYVHNNTVLATALEITGHGVVWVGNEYNYQELLDGGHSASKLRAEGIPGTVSYGHIVTPTLSGAIAAFDDAKKAIAAMEIFEIEASVNDCMRIAALYASRKDAVANLWHKFTPTIMRIGKDGCAAITPNASAAMKAKTIEQFED